ncbi:hypothetical protein J7J84_04160 [bacterium]|nr:hypothetical protein [bacterium]
MYGTKVLIGLLIATTVAITVALLTPVIGAFGRQGTSFAWDSHRVEFWEVVDYRVVKREPSEENGQKKLIVRITMLPGPTTDQVRNTLLKVLKDEAENDSGLGAIMVLAYTTEDLQYIGYDGTLGKAIWGPCGRFYYLPDSNEPYRIDYYPGKEIPKFKRPKRRSSGGGGGGSSGGGGCGG